MPPKSLISSEEEVENNGSQFGQKNTASKPLIKILLVGKDQSGTSAIYKQVHHIRNSLTINDISLSSPE